MDASQSMTSSESVSILPPPPSEMYGQFNSTTDQPFAMQQNAITHFRHHPNNAFMSASGHNPFSGMAQRTDSVSSGTNGESVPFASSSGSYRPARFSTGFTEQTLLTSPQTTFAFAISSPKREADANPGQSVKHGRSGSFKRQRLDLSISTDLPYSQTRNQQPLNTAGQQQYQYGHVSQPGSAMIPQATLTNPPSSADSYSYADVSMSDGNMNRFKSTPIPMAGNQSLLGNNHNSTSNFHNTHLQQASPSLGGNGDAQSAQGPNSYTPFPQMQSQSQMFSYAPVMSSLTSAMPSNGSYLDERGFNPAYSITQPIPAPITANVSPTEQSHHQDINARFTLVMRQQPERARLCSFKEENDTIDRRPVDPPPIVEIIPNGASSIGEMLVHHHLFMKAILVAPHPELIMNPSEFSPTRKGSQVYQELRLPAGQEATTGEATQTPEKLQDLEGNEGAFCVFGRLSIRMPGQFRLRFVLYETTQSGIREHGFVISELFEVFSPKLFGGMRQSTTLTRHFASQGLKIKLRQDGTSRSGRRKKAQPTESEEQSTNAIEDVATTDDRHQKSESIFRPKQNSLISPRNTLIASYGQVTQPTEPALPPQRAFPSVPASDAKYDPICWTGDDNSMTRYSTSSHESQNSSGLVPAIVSFPQRLSMPNGYLLDESNGFQTLSNLKMGIPHNYTNEGTLSTIEYTLDSSPNDKRNGGSASSAGDADMAATTVESTPKSGSSGKSKMALPSIERAMQESSIWLDKSGFVPPDEMVSGGIVFRNGIRYGGDDGFMPPMSFGRLPGLIYDGILPSTPGASTGTDLSNFSLKNRLANPSLSPYPMMNNSTPPPPGKPSNMGLMHYLSNSTFTGSALSSRGETSNGANSSSSSDKDKSAKPRKTSGDSDAPVKPSQFADLEDKPDVAAVQGVEGFCAALSSSFERKVRSFTLALPRRISRGSKGSVDEPMRDVSGENQQSPS